MHSLTLARHDPGVRVGRGVNEEGVTQVHIARVADREIGRAVAHTRGVCVAYRRDE